MADSTFYFSEESSDDELTQMNDYDEAFSSEDEMSFNVDAPEFVPASDLECESSDDEGYATAAENPRNFRETILDELQGERGKDLTKVNPPCVPTAPERVAATRIQVMWRRYTLKKRQKEIEEQVNAKINEIEKAKAAGADPSRLKPSVQTRRLTAELWEVGIGKMPPKKNMQPENLRRKLRRKLREKEKKRMEQTAKNTEENYLSDEHRLKALKMCEEIVQTFGTIIVYAPPQSGKTHFTIMTALLHLLEGITPIILTRRQNQDRQQFIERINDLTKLLNERCMDARKDWDNPDEKFLWTFEDGRSSLAVEGIADERTQTMIEDALVSNTPIMPVLLGNETQLEHIHRVIENANKRRGEKCKYMLLIDECTAVDGGKPTTKQGNPSASAWIKELKKKAVKTVAIDATPMGAFVSDPSITPAMLFYLEPNMRKYRGFEDFNFIFLERNPKYLSKEMSWDEMVKTDPDMLPWIDQMSQKGTWTSMRDTRSRLMRLCNTGLAENRETQFAAIRRLYPDKFAMIKMDRKGTFTYNPETQQTEKFKGPFSKAVSLFNDPVKFPRILCLIGKAGDRCLSFVSDDYTIHLNEDYVTFPESTCISLMYQRMRLCGNNRGKGPLNMYTTKESFADLKKGLTMVDEFIARARAMKNQSMCKSISEMPMQKSKFSKRGLASTKFKESYNKVKGNDGGWSVEDKYKPIEIKDENGNVVDTVPLIVENPKKKAEKAKKPKDYPALFRKWSSGADSKIAVFMRNICPDTKYSEAALDDMLANARIVSRILIMKEEFNKESSRGYGRLFREEDGKYFLVPDLVELYKEHFNYQ